MGNGTRSFETLLRYRGAAMAEFWRALRTLKALQAEHAAAVPAGADAIIEPGRQRRPDAVEAPPRRVARAPLAHRAQPDQPERGSESQLPDVPSEPSARGRNLHEPAAPWLPNEPEPDRILHELSVGLMPNETGAWSGLAQSSGRVPQHESRPASRK